MLLRKRATWRLFNLAQPWGPKSENGWDPPDYPAPPHGTRRCIFFKKKDSKKRASCSIYPHQGWGPGTLEEGVPRRLCLSGRQLLTVTRAALYQFIGSSSHSKEGFSIIGAMQGAALWSSFVVSTSTGGNCNIPLRPQVNKWKIKGTAYPYYGIKCGLCCRQGMAC